MVTIFYTDDSNCGRGDAERVESATDASAARAGPLSRRSPHPAQFHQTVRCRRQPTPIHQSTGYLFIRLISNLATAWASSMSWTRQLCK